MHPEHVWLNKNADMVNPFFFCFVLLSPSKGEQSQPFKSFIWQIVQVLPYLIAPMWNFFSSSNTFFFFLKPSELVYIPFEVALSIYIKATYSSLIIFNLFHVQLTLSLAFLLPINIKKSFVWLPLLILYYFVFVLINEGMLLICL